MVTTNSPYTRTSWTDDFAWNEIIGKVNDLCENPPDGCDPIPGLEEVDPDHIWTKIDIIEVQDKLKEICDDIEFTDLGELWTSTIIDEIVEALDVGWCNCEESDFGVWADEFFEATPLSTCECCYPTSVREFSFHNILFEERTTYTSPCFERNTAEFLASRAEAFDLYNIAHENSKDWVEDRRKELLQQRIVEEKSTELLAKKAKLENLQNQLAACQSGPGDCFGLTQQIAELEKEIADLEEEIQEAKDRRDEAKEKADEHLAAADEAAIENWGILFELESWSPVYVNMVEELYSQGEVPEIGVVSEKYGEDRDWWVWGLGGYPYDSHTRSSWILQGVANTGFRSYTMFGYFTPSGLPYTASSPGKSFGEVYWRWCKELRSFHVSTGWTAWRDTGCLVSVRGRIYDEAGEVEWPELLTHTFTHEPTVGTAPAPEYEPNPDQEV